MKKKINHILELFGHFLIYFSCHFNLPGLCAYIIKISILENKFIRKNIKKKNIVIVLDRSIGHRDIEIIKETSNKSPEFLYLRRSITKIILFYFCQNKKVFFNYIKPPVTEKDYFGQSKKNRYDHENFWSKVILNLKKSYKNKNLSFVTFNFTYYAEIGLYEGCKRNNIQVKLWHKEGIKTNLEAALEAKTWGNKFYHVFDYFSKISVYNELVKKMFIKINKSNSKKTTVNGCPRVKDYITKKKYYKKINTLLFLSFDKKRGIPEYKENKNKNWSLSYNIVIDILNDLSNNKNLKILIKKKSNTTHQKISNLNKNIEVFSQGTAQKFINQADIIIGHNSASTIEAIVNGKYVMVPFFEKNIRLKKYLYNFNKELIYTSKENMKKSILNLINKKVLFPLSNQKHKKTITYYLGNNQNTTEKYLRFLRN
tara:strand:+ start:1059 stop:2339 length:1281 start_codon:yes stop_codon:yes gene_type:complete